MTREEAKKCLLGVVDVTTQSGIHLLPIEVREAIKVLLEDVNLPEGLDEMSAKELKRYYAKHDSGMLIPRKYTELALHFANFGAKWMAGQGITKEGIVDGYGWFIDLSDNTHIDLDPCMARRPAFNLKDGEEVIIQIRKK